MNANAVDACSTGRHNAPMRLDFYYDIVCPYAYLASTQIEAVAARTGAELVWHPVLLGGIFRHVNADQVPMNGMSKPKARLNLLDMKRWADRWSIPLTMPMQHPRRTVSAMRLLVATRGETRVALTKALYRAYWVEGRDVADRTVLAEIATKHGVDAAVIDSADARQGLFDTTAEAAGHGAFGLPASVVDGTLWWGQDRLNFVETALGGQPPVHVPTPDADRRPRVRFFHDFASPFSYLAATQIEALAAAHGAELQWSPILLGGLFREIGTPDVPLFQMNRTKQAYVGRDLEDWARWWGVDYSFPSHFPMRSILPLRIALAAPETTLPLYRAAWGQNRRIDDPEAVSAVLTEAGFDAASLLQATSDAEVKAALRANTEAAKEAGACGVPTFQIWSDDGVDPLLVWGQDRLELVGRMLDGWRPDGE